MKHSANTILLVEDEAVFAESVSHSLRMEGYMVIQVLTSEEAINIISSGAHAIDLVLMDTILNEGIDSIQAAQVINKKHNIPLLFIVKNEENETLAKTEKITSYGYVVKNIGIPVMMASIKAAIKLHKVHQELQEKALSISESQYLSTLNAMIDAIHVVDKRMQILLINNAFKQWIKNFGLAVETEGKTVFEIFPFLSQKVKEEYERVFATGEILITEETNIIGDREYNTETRKIPVLKDNKITEVITIVRDITEHKRADETIRLMAEKYRNILETMEEGLFENDLVGHYTFVNNAACRLMGHHRDELIGMSYRNLTSPETSRYLYEVFHRIYETGEPELLLDYEVIHKDGSIRIFQSNSQLMRDALGKPIGFRNLVRDVTELKKTEKEKTIIETQLFQAQKMESVGKLAGGVAHDFNNMLTVILGYTELIKSQLPQDGSLLKDILEIEKAAGRSKDLTRQLLAYSRKEIIVPRPIDLEDLIVGAEKTLSRLLGENIDLRFYPLKNIWKVKLDSSQMEQILINLAANARDAMPNGGKLTIETENIQLNEAYCKIHPGVLPGDYILLEVSDDGIGMDKETLQHLFEPFFTTKETGKGTGLGLATVYGIVKQNGGFINVYSEPGKGTIFKMYFPRSLEEGVAKKKTGEDLITSDTGTILLVEDDDMVRKITTEMLEAIGYTILSISSPLEALSFFRNDTTHIDLLITDMVMPKISGKELSDRVKAIQPRVKILFMSGYSTNAIAHQGVLEEGIHFIQKPFSMHELARKVKNAIKG